jgi:hypothetical protein
MADAAMRKCWSVYERPPHLKARYRRLAILSHERHLAQLNVRDGDTLAVCCDWLLWQRCLDRGLHCTFYEEGLVEDHGLGAFQDKILLMANEWVLIDGEDATEFQGVSLGRAFNAEVVRVLVSYLKMEAALRALIEAYLPNEIVLFDYRHELEALDPQTRRQMVETVATEHRIALTDCWDAIAADDPSRPVADFRIDPRPVRPSPLKLFALVLYGAAARLSAWSWLIVARRRKRVLILAGQNLTLPLVKAFSGHRILPILPADQQTKRFGFLRSCLMKGVVLAATPHAHLSIAECSNVNAIAQRLRASWREKGPGLTEAIRSFVTSNILDRNRLIDIARQVKQADAILRRYRPQRILVDGVRNPPGRLYMELAKDRNVPVDFTWHSSLVPHNLDFDALSGNTIAAPLVSRCLTWGKINENWLRAVGAKAEIVRTGNPNADRYRHSGQAHVESAGNALVLQYSPINHDLRGLYAAKYSYFVDLVRLLRHKGYRNIVLKLHPGGGWKPEYYRAIAEFFGLECAIERDKSFIECVAWADFAVGPVVTGGLQEVLAAGKPFYAFALKPHCYDLSYYDSIDVLSDLGEFEAALAGGRSQDSHRLLNEFYSFDEIRNASQLMWQALDDDAPRRDLPQERYAETVGTGMTVR